MAAASNDHDLLVRIDENLKNLKEEFGKFRETSTTDISRKADATDLTSLDTRVVSLEKSVWKAIGAIAFVEIAAGIATAIHYYIR